jgi:alpha-tubulin suppressor-like RCC1 family protein
VTLFKWACRLRQRFAILPRRRILEVMTTLRGGLILVVVPVLAAVVLRCTPFEGAPLADAGVVGLDGAVNGGDGGGPVQGRDIDSLAVGTTGACFVTKQGVVYCAGRAVDGAFLRKGEAPGDVACIPVSFGYAVPKFSKVSLPKPTKRIAISHRARCVLDENEDILCWGGNTDGELGHAPGTEGDEECDSGRWCNLAPKPLAGLRPGIRFAQISAGFSHFCARSAEGEVYCWGSNQAGQVGRAPSSTALPALVALPSSAALVSLGDATSCAALRAGGVVCWGRNRAGAVNGMAAPLDIAAPTAVPGSTTLMSAALDVDVMGGCAFAPMVNSTTCWGTNQTGLLGLPDARSSRVLPEVKDVRELYLANGAALALVGAAERSKTWTWGTSARGALATGTGLANALPPEPRVALDGARLAAMGPAESGLAVINDKLFGWGSNSCGQLGHAPGTEGDEDLVDPFAPAVRAAALP